MFYIIGLGNPGKEYEKSRHNTGRMAVSSLAEDLDLPPFELDPKAKSLVSKNKRITLILPETFVNKSGTSATFFVKSKKTAANLIVAYDDIDLPLGVIKISWNKNSGGHRGLESIIKALKTKEFVRVRVGISPQKKPQGEKAVLDFILGKFKPSEETVLKKVLKTASVAIQTIVEEGRERAMNQFN